MIKNERQYRISKAALRRFTHAASAAVTIAADVDPVIARAAQDAHYSQAVELRAQIAEYEALKAGQISILEVDSIESLPLTLIKARIASGLSQKALGELLGLKEQQIQRYEDSNYDGASLGRLIDVSRALDISIRQEILLGVTPGRVKEVIQKLDSAGLPESFVLKRLTSISTSREFRNNPSHSSSRLVAEILSRAKRVFGWTSEELLGRLPLTLPKFAQSVARFKVSRSRNPERLGAYVVYAHYLAMRLLDATRHVTQGELPATPEDFYNDVCVGYGAISFENVLRFLWSKGVAVLPLRDSGAFDGAYWRVDGRHVIALKQGTGHTSRWLFDLLHDYCHAIQHPELLANEVIEAPATSTDRLHSTDEVAASEFACEVIVAGRGQELIERCELATQGRLEYLKKVLPSVTEEMGITLGAAANFLAYKLAAQGANWWGSATNLQTDEVIPTDVARDILFENARFEVLSSLDRELLMDALSERSVDP